MTTPSTPQSQTRPTRVLLIGPTGCGKSSVICSMASLLRLSSPPTKLPKVGHEDKRGTSLAESYPIRDIEFIDTPGFGDGECLDDKFNRELSCNPSFKDFDIVLYCYRARARTIGIPYGKMFGKGCPVTLLICDFPTPDQMAVSLASAKSHVESQSLTVRNHFFIPPGGLVLMTPDLNNLYTYIKTFNNASKKVNFKAGPISKEAKDIIQARKNENKVNEELKRIKLRITQVDPRTEKVYCSVGMANGAEHRGEWNVPAGRMITSSWVVDLSRNDRRNNGRAEILHSATQCRYFARMPERIGGFLSSEGQWFDADFYVTHQIDTSSLRHRHDLLQNDLNAKIAVLNDLKSRLPVLFAEIKKHWDAYYATKA